MVRDEEDVDIFFVFMPPDFALTHFVLWHQPAQWHIWPITKIPEARYVLAVNPLFLYMDNMIDKGI